MATVKAVLLKANIKREKNIDVPKWKLMGDGGRKRKSFAPIPFWKRSKIFTVLKIPYVQQNLFKKAFVGVRVTHFRVHRLCFFFFHIFSKARNIFVFYSLHMMCAFFFCFSASFERLFHRKSRSDFQVHRLFWNHFGPLVVFVITGNHYENRIIYRATVTISMERSLLKKHCRHVTDAASLSRWRDIWWWTVVKKNLN